MKADELRQLYIDYFKDRGHLHLPGAPIVPIDALGVEDKSTLFTSAGMQQFKSFFTGDAVPPSRRVVTVQKCVRTGDIESVGDYSHCTFFEMLGNFSFGDYFKSEVIPWTWEFLTEKLGLEGERLCVTVYQDDDDAFAIWHDVVGLPEHRIHRLGEDKNYWPANAVSEGPNGPCGPCTEIFYRVAPENEMTVDPSLTPTQSYKVDDNAGRWLEVWNNVFTQFNRGEDGQGKPILTPLPNKNNDTGAGFERILCLLQGVTSVFDTDLFKPAIGKIEELSGTRYGGTMSAEDFAFRVLAEHARSAVFCIADGILPSNEGRGYVLRRIIRRAIRFGKSVLGFDTPFLHEVAPMVVGQMGGFYTELTERRELILKTLHSEEERFRRTLDSGMVRLSELLEERPEGSVLNGSDAFSLYDTYGFPLELTQELAAERGVSIDEAGFAESMEEQRERSREATGIDRDVFKSIGAALVELQRTAPATVFTGYDATDGDSRILGIIKDGELTNLAKPGEEVEIVLDQTPFYAESGGQAGDAGLLLGDESMKVDILDTRKAAGLFLHRGKVVSGTAKVDSVVKAVVNRERRLQIRRNHTATHLLHAALREVLGGHVHQKGSLVAPDRLRFDFTHTSPMTDDEIRRVEDIVNGRILADERVAVYSNVPISEARSRGAMALFGEKYGESVRMVEVPGFSIELCGGIHLDRTSQAGLCKILSETGVAAGVRRIEAVTGSGVYAYLQEREETLAAASRILKTSPRDVLTAVEKLIVHRGELEKQIQQLRNSASGTTEALHVADVSGVAVVTGVVPNADGETLSAVADRIARERGSAVIVLGAVSDGKVLLVVKATADLVNRGVHAGNLVREVAKLIGGGGGGRPDFAQAGGRDSGKLDDAIAAVPSLVEKQVK